MKLTVKIRTGLLSVLILCTCACKKNYLDRKPSDLITEQEVFKNIENAERFVNTTYQSLPNMFQSWGWPLSSATDETNQAIDNSGADAGSFNTGSMSPSNFPMSGLWGEFYGKIRSCNLFLKNYDKIPHDPNDPQRRSRLKGEVLVLRAFYYFQLVIRWGDVPLLQEVENPFDNPNGIYFKRNSVAEVMGTVVKDLDDAMALLPPTYAERPNNWGRASRVIALALKGRALLYYASALYNPANDLSRWTRAADACKAALDSALTNGYTLNDNYGEIFTQYFNKEVIWSRPAPPAYGDGGIDREMNPRGANGYGNVNPIQELVDDYEMKGTGLPITDPTSGYNPQRPYEGRDPRFYATILYPGCMWKGRPLNPNGDDAPRPGQSATNYWPRKYLLEGVNLFSNTGATDRKWVLIRTAELYLNYAEAQNEANGPDAAVLGALNAVRGRAGIPAVNGGTKEVLRARIRHERRIELALEAHRFWDTRRWKIAEVTDNKEIHGVTVTGTGNVTYSYPVVEKRVFDSKRAYWLPIPQSEMDKVSGRNPEFVQNPGW
ncbi:RagB/SusD family nutrient uptake outer membrane protein [Chitinophaga qingshengii]|uniref:RagB/SusD family nutrient uptake outer membrane protein n=1 Tax=Chitinophaga qingshengii TaxID=1569794 RepID=A0ABR7TNJ0_9BACT|nr:RagB/SusD family nutrient uptake outer membrane protein [Chitinophaga qingshengii]MBC9931563.1 RagB/SusD family nutrient uptake outer membrane protein [Chitinophaga qingshengii]